MGHVGQRHLDDRQVQLGRQPHPFCVVEPAVRRPPVGEAAQGLDARHLAGVEVHDRLVHELEDPIDDHPLDGLDACPSAGIHGSLLGPEGCPFQELRPYATPRYVAGQSAQP